MCSRFAPSLLQGCSKCASCMLRVCFSCKRGLRIRILTLTVGNIVRPNVKHAQHGAYCAARSEVVAGVAGVDGDDAIGV